jgi:hypothetical protein
MVQGRRRAQSLNAEKPPGIGYPGPSQGGVTLSRTHLDKLTEGALVPAYSSSELIRGVVSDARALASIRACSHCLRVRFFRWVRTVPETLKRP